MSAARSIATLWGIGRIPKTPGTAASLVTLPPAYLIASYLGPSALFLAALIVFLVGWRVGEAYVRETGAEDPQEVVIDEVAGQLVTLAVVPPEVIPYLVGFAMFRLFDIWKPFPVSWLDQNVRGGLGVMADDIAAGVYGLIIMWLGGIIAGRL